MSEDIEHDAVVFEQVSWTVRRVFDQNIGELCSSNRQGWYGKHDNGEKSRDVCSDMPNTLADDLVPGKASVLRFMADVVYLVDRKEEWLLFGFCEYSKFSPRVTDAMILQVFMQIRQNIEVQMLAVCEKCQLSPYFS